MNSPSSTFAANILPTRNHERFCGSVLSVEEAVVRGCLYELPSGIPVLEVPEADVLAHGTADPSADLQGTLLIKASSHPGAWTGTS